jgi:hypothetical protein
MSDDREYAGSVSLIVTGKTLDPELVTRSLGITPSDSWRPGEVVEVAARSFTKLHEEGGWKYHFDHEKKDASIEFQLETWTHILRDKVRALKYLRSQGNYCRLSWFAASSGTVSIVIPTELQLELASLGLDWEISIWLQEDPPSQ